MAMFVNYEGLTYRWDYGQQVSVFDNRIEVDAFTLPFREHIPTEVFLRGMVHYAAYILDAALYSSENMS